jgi:uncharacterized protein (TIGR03437 family)
MRLIVCIAVASLGSLMGATAADRRSAIASTAEAPLSFEQATGGGTRWTARGNGFRLAVGAAEIEAGLGDEQLRIRFVGGNDKAASTGLDALPGKVNYFIGRDPKSWLRDIPTYARVRYSGVYPGVDVLWHGNQGRLEYDLDLQPGADSSRIAMRFDGARKLSLDASGDLRVDMAAGSLSLKLPLVYQDGAGGRQRIDALYELRAGNQVGFHLAAYDKSRPLVIDPTLVYASYFGNSLAVQAMAVDGAGNVYIGGYTSASNPLPTVNALQPGNARNNDAFVTKFDTTGKTVLYSTYLGGSGDDKLLGLAVDASGNLAGTGYTTSTDFPIVNPVISVVSQASVFAFKLNSAGSALAYSTYLPAFQGYGGAGVALDASGNAYFTGAAWGPQTTPGALAQGEVHPGGEMYCDPCAYVAKLSSAGAEVYLATLAAYAGNAIAVDAQGAAYVAGANGSGAVVIKLSPDGSSLVWSKTLKGYGTSASAIALGAGGVVYFGGTTSSSSLPVTQGAAQPTYGGDGDAFVASLSADGTSFGFVTYLGGARSDSLTSLAVGADGLILTGTTYSRDFPVAAALQPAFPAPPYVFVKSTDSGASFAAADNGLPDTMFGMNPLPDPSTPGTIVMDTPEGVYLSTDDGVSWSNVLPGNGGNTARSLSNPSVLYSCQGATVWKSTDGGHTWNTVGPRLAYTGYVGISPSNPNTVFVLSQNSEYRFTGSPMYVYPTQTPMSLVPWTYGSVVASPDGSMYAISGEPGYTNNSYGVFKTTDAGLTWTHLTNGVPSTFLPGFTVSASNPSILYASDGNNVYKSTNAGAAWTEVGKGAGVAHLAADLSDPQTVYGVGCCGVLVSRDGGATWVPTGGAMELSYRPSIALSPTTEGEMYLSEIWNPSGFVAKLSTDGKALEWSTYYGAYTQMAGAAPAPSGAIWVAGTADTGLPVTPDARNGNVFGISTAFLASIADSTAPCSYSISLGTQYFYAAAIGQFSVTAPGGCAWTATASDTWIHVTRGSGIGTGAIWFSVDANNTASTRTGAISVNGQTFTIVEPPSSCTYQLSNPVLSPSGGTATITVTAPAGCPWDVKLQNGDTATVTSATTGTGNGTVTISIPPNAGATPNGYGVLIGGQTTYIEEVFSGQAVVSGAISAGAFGAFSTAAPGSWVEIYGSNLASTTRSWTGTDFDGNTAPTRIDGVSVYVGDYYSAYVAYVSPGQVNVQLPSNIGTGPFLLWICNASACSPAATITVNPTAPGLLAPPSFNIGGKQYVVAQLSDGAYVLPTGAIAGLNSRPAKPGETIVIYGIGFGTVTPDTPAGTIAPASTHITAPLQFLFGQTPPQQVPYAGLAPGLVGLYQFNITVPQVSDSDLVPLTFTLGGAAGAQTLYTAVHQ